MNTRSLQVGWDDLRILRAEDSRTNITTSVVLSCYVLIGRNAFGDIILGHFRPAYVSQEKALSVVQTYLDRENQMVSQRRLNLSDFNFEYISGPVKPGEKQNEVYYDISCHRERGIEVLVKKIQEILELNDLSRFYS